MKGEAVSFGKLALWRIHGSSKLVLSACICSVEYTSLPIDDKSGQFQRRSRSGSRKRSLIWVVIAGCGLDGVLRRTLARQAAGISCREMDSE